MLSNVQLVNCSSNTRSCFCLLWSLKRSQVSASNNSIYLLIFCNGNAILMGKKFQEKKKQYCFEHLSLFTWFEACVCKPKQNCFQASLLSSGFSQADEIWVKLTKYPSVTPKWLKNIWDRRAWNCTVSNLQCNLQTQHGTNFALKYPEKVGRN